MNSLFSFPAITYPFSSSGSGTRVALKVLPEGGAEEEAEIENEVRIMRQLKHENIVALHGAWYCFLFRS